MIIVQCFCCDHNWSLLIAMYTSPHTHIAPQMHYCWVLLKFCLLLGCLLCCRTAILMCCFTREELTGQPIQTAQHFITVKLADSLLSKGFIIHKHAFAFLFDWRIFDVWMINDEFLILIKKSRLLHHTAQDVVISSRNITLAEADKHLWAIRPVSQYDPESTLPLWDFKPRLLSSLSGTNLRPRCPDGALDHKV